MISLSAPATGPMILAMLFGATVAVLLAVCYATLIDRYLTGSERVACLLSPYLFSFLSLQIYCWAGGSCGS